MARQLMTLLSDLPPGVAQAIVAGMSREAGYA